MFSEDSEPHDTFVPGPSVVVEDVGVIITPEGVNRNHHVGPRNLPSLYAPEHTIDL
jgi:hypothetical protein